MSYIALMNEKAKIIAACAELDKREKELNERIELASHSYAQTLLKEICEKVKQIEELGYHVMSADFCGWIDSDSFYLDDWKAER